MQQLKSDNQLTNCQLLDTFDFSPWVYDPLSKSVSNFVKVQNDQIKAVNFIAHTSSTVVDGQREKINL